MPIYEGSALCDIDKSTGWPELAKNYIGVQTSEIGGVLAIDHVAPQSVFTFETENADAANDPCVIWKRIKEEIQI